MEGETSKTLTSILGKLATTLVKDIVIDKQIKML